MASVVIAPHFRLQEWVAEEKGDVGAFDETFRWIAEHGIVAEGGLGTGRYEESVAKLAP